MSGKVLLKTVIEHIKLGGLAVLLKTVTGHIKLGGSEEALLKTVTGHIKLGCWGKSSKSWYRVHSVTKTFPDDQDCLTCSKHMRSVACEEEFL